MKGFKSTGKGAVKYMKSFPSGTTPCGAQGGGGVNSCKHMSSCKTTVRGHTRGKPGFAMGGPVVDSSVVRRGMPVTSADAEFGGRGSLRPGFSKGGPAAPRSPGTRGKKMAGAAARLMRMGFSSQVAASKTMGGGKSANSCAMKKARGGMVCGMKKSKKCD